MLENRCVRIDVQFLLLGSAVQKYCSSHVARQLFIWLATTGKIPERWLQHRAQSEKIVVFVVRMLFEVKETNGLI